jgi:hypothetical protein
VVNNIIHSLIHYRAQGRGIFGDTGGPDMSVFVEIDRVILSSVGGCHMLVCQVNVFIQKLCSVSRLQPSVLLIVSVVDR